MSKNPISNGRGSGRRPGPAVHRDGSRQLFDDVLVLAGELGRGLNVLGVRNLQSLAASAQSVTGTVTDMPNLRSQAAEAGERLGSLADYVMHTDIEQMAKDVGAFARRHPVAALALVVAGSALVASRFRKRGPGKTVRAAVRPKSSPEIAAKPAARRRKGANGQAHADA